MSKSNHHQGDRVRPVRVKGVRRHPPDLRKLASALIALAEAQAETDAAVDHARREATERCRERKLNKRRGGQERPEGQGQ